MDAMISRVALADFGAGVDYSWRSDQRNSVLPMPDFVRGFRCSLDLRPVQSIKKYNVTFLLLLEIALGDIGPVAKPRLDERGHDCAEPECRDKLEQAHRWPLGRASSVTFISVKTSEPC